MLEYLDEDVSALPMRDILNLLERYHFIDSADEWGYIRELRNDIVSVLNELISKVPILKSIYKRMKATV